MRLIDADELLARMRERCDSCPHNGNREYCLNLCEWREAIDEVEDMPEIEMNVSASGGGMAIDPAGEGNHEHQGRGGVLRMRITNGMKAEDEKRWHARNIVTELAYCGDYMCDRKNITNLDIRFYAYIMRKAAEALKEQEDDKK